MALLKKKKTKIKVALSKVYMTDSQKKKYGVCEHNHVNYNFLEKLCRYQQKFIKSQFKKEADLEKTLSEADEKFYGLEIDYESLETDHKELKSLHKELTATHEDCLCKNEKILKDHHEITRAYEGLHILGRECSEFKINLKKHQKMLPEYKFHQKHELLESGRVKHIYKLIPPKIKKKGDKK